MCFVSVLSLIFTHCCFTKISKDQFFPHFLPFFHFCFFPSLPPSHSFSFLPLLPLFLRFPPSPLFHIKLFFIEAHAAWNSIPPGAAGWNTRLFWAQAKQMLALGVPPETSLHASPFFLLLSHFHAFCLFSFCPWFPIFLPGLSFSRHFLTLSSLSESLPSFLSRATS